jgi:hypothetical protein
VKLGVASFHHGAMILKVGVMHMLMKTRCTCSCGMALVMQVSTTRFPTTWNSDCEGNHRRRGVCVASRALTTKIPSEPLVTITWLQHTWYPRFRRGTFGYGITTSPTREVEYEYGVFMRMHVSMPKVPKCICHAMHTLKVTIILIQNVVSKTEKNKFRIERSD